MERATLVLALFLGLCPGFLLAQPCITPVPDVYPARNRSTGILTADFDGDTWLDVALHKVTHWDPMGTNAWTIRVFRNQGDGMLDTGLDLPPFIDGSYGWMPPIAVDLDGRDGPDLYKTAPGGEFWIYWNNGDGTFENDTQNLSDTGYQAAGTFPADLNLDGRPDFVVTRQAGNDVTVLFNQGNRVFAGESVHTVGLEPGPVLAAELDGANGLDLAVLNRGSEDLSLLYGDGAGGLLPEVRVPLGGGAHSLFLEDVDGGNGPDLLVTYETADEVGVRRNDGTGSFGAEARFPAGVRPRAIHASDLNGDTHPDLLIVNQGSSDLSVLHGDGTGTFRNVERVGTIQLPVMVSAGDLNKDGLPELAIASGELAMVVHRNLGDGRFTRRDTYQAIREPSQYDAPPEEVFISADVNWHGGRVLIAADLDGANGPDIAASLSRDSAIGVFLNRGDGTLTGPYYTPVGAEPAAITSADFDRLDGPDLAVANEGGDTVSILLNLGNGVFLSADQYPVGAEPRDIEAADLDGRNGPDLVVMNRGSRDISVLLNDGSGGFAQQALYPEPAAPVSRSFSRLVVIDLDRAAGPDLVLLRWERQGVWIYRNLGDGTFAPAEWLELPFGTEGRDMVSDDFDRDDWPDLAIRTNAELLTCLNRGGLLETSSRRRVGAAYGSRMTTADMDGMSGPDILVPGGIVSMLFNDGGGDFVREQDVFVGSDAFAATTADLDGDGGLEIVTADRYSGTMSVARSCPDEIDLLCNSDIVSLYPVIPPFLDIFSPAGGLDEMDNLHQAGFPSGSYDPDPLTCSDAGGPLVFYQVTYPVPSMRVVRESDGRVRFFY